MNHQMMMHLLGPYLEQAARDMLDAPASGVAMGLAASQCPLCEGDDQHEHGCSLEGKEHIYVQGGLVDWGSTLELDARPDWQKDICPA
jgi:hypothetical protein